MFTIFRPVLAVSNVIINWKLLLSLVCTKKKVERSDKTWWSLLLWLKPPKKSFQMVLTQCYICSNSSNLTQIGKFFHSISRHSLIEAKPKEKHWRLQNEQQRLENYFSMIGHVAMGTVANKHWWEMTLMHMSSNNCDSPGCEKVTTVLTRYMGVQLLCWNRSVKNEENNPRFTWLWLPIVTNNELLTESPLDMTEYKHMKFGR